ncbi:MAG: beta strand repeat-containing protein, partial [Flavobacteriales bacterium]
MKIKPLQISIAMIWIMLIQLTCIGNMQLYGQSTQNFGTTTGSHTSGASTTFIPNPTTGTTYARIGTGGGSINKVTASNPLGTSGAYIRAVAPTAGSVNKVSPIVNNTSGKVVYARAKILFGDASANNTATSGTWYMFIGNGAMYSDGNSFSGTQVFSGLRFSFGTGGAITMNNRNNTNWNTTGLSTSSLASGIFYDFEIIGNNQASGNVTYSYNGVSRSVAINTMDLYINGVLVGSGISKAAMANNVDIGSITFYGENSVSNVANIFIDDVVLQNTVPASIQRLTQPSPHNLSSSNYNFTTWANTSAVGSYPSNMVFHWGTVNTVDPTLPNTATQDYVWGYNYSAQSRINGLGANGIEFLNTNPGHTSLTSGNNGEAVLGLNTTGRQNIQVSWTAARQTSNGNRYLLRGQYRIGNTGAFTDLPGTTAQIEFSSANTGPTNYGPITLPAACENQTEVQIRWVYYWSGSGSGARDGIRLDDISVTSSPLATASINTSSISGSPFCVGSSFGAAVDVPYTISGTFNSGNIFTAQLSDASGSFASPVNIGTLSSTSAGTISATIPAGTASGSGYRIRVTGSNPATTGSDNGSNLTVQTFAAPTSVTANCGNQSASVSWSNPACFDEIMVVAKNAAFSTAMPTGDGSAYTANLVYGSGTTFDGGYVVYKGTGTASGTITGLTGDVLHYFKVFARKGTNWIDASSVSCTPTNTCATENFANLPTASSTTYISRTWTGTDGFTWTAEGARTDQTLNGKAICFGTSGNRWVTSHTYSNGLGTLSFSYVRGFTNTNTRTLQVWVNGVQQGGNINVSTTSDVHQTYSQTLNIAGSVEVEIRSTSTGQVIVDDITWSCYATPCFTPSTHASGVNSTFVTTTGALISWTNGDGVRRIVVVKEGSDVDAIPINNTSYTANAAFGSGTEIGTGNFVVYNNTGNNVSLSNLVPGRRYFVKVFEYACNPGSEEYYVSGTPGNTNFFTSPAVPTALTVGCRDNSSIELSWSPPSNGDIDGYLVVAREAAGEHSVNSLNPSSQTFNTNYSTAPTFGSTTPFSRVVYRGTSTSATITNLTANSNTTFRVYAYRIVGAEYKYSTATST